IHLDGFARGSEDTFSSQGTRKYYRIAVEDGQRVHAAATIAPDPYEDGLPEEPEALEVTAGFLTADGDTCTGSSTEQIGESHVGDGPVSATAVSEAAGPDGCRGSELFLLVIRKGPRAFATELPVEIQGAVQPPGLGGGSRAADRAPGGGPGARRRRRRPRGGGGARGRRRLPAPAGRERAARPGTLLRRGHPVGAGILSGGAGPGRDRPGLGAGGRGAEAALAHRGGLGAR